MKLKNIEIKDNYPLSIMLSGKSIWNKSDNGIINIERLLDRHSDSCLITAISGTEIMDSSKTSCCHAAETRDFSHERSRPMISIIKYVCHFTKLYDIIIL